MITAEHDFVKEISLRPDVWPHLTADGYEKEDYSPSDNAIYFKHGAEGYASFHPVKDGVWEGHIAMKRKAKNTLEFGKECLREMGERGAKEILCGIPLDNRAAAHYVKRLGFKFRDYTRDCISKRGRKMGIVIMEYGYA